MNGIFYETNFAYYSFEEGTGDYAISLSSVRFVDNGYGLALDHQGRKVHIAGFSDITPDKQTGLIGNFFYDETEMLEGGVDEMNSSSGNLGELDSDGYETFIPSPEFQFLNNNVNIAVGDLVITEFSGSAIKFNYTTTYSSGHNINGLYFGSIEGY